MSKPVIRVNFEALDKLRNNASYAEFSRKINVSEATLSRIRNGKENPGREFIAAILKTFPKKKFEQIFFLD